MKKSITLIIVWLIATIPLATAQDIGYTMSDVSITYDQNSTTFTWTTNEPASTVIHYGTTELNQNATLTDLVTSHSVAIDTQPGTSYKYRVTSCTVVTCKSSPIKTVVAGPFAITADIPSYARAAKIDISGVTRAGAKVTVFVNDAQVREDTITDGTFLFQQIPLSAEVNTIRLRAELGGENAQATYTTTVDKTPPLLNVTLPSVVVSPNVNALIRVSEPVNLTIKHSASAAQKPLRPLNLAQKAVGPNSAEITWSETDGAIEYRIYRNKKPIGITTTTTYREFDIASNTQYQYQVSAISANCAESELSDILTLTTQAGSSTELAKPDVYPSCFIKPETKQISGETTLSLPLKEGENLITFEARDKAGFISITEERVRYDSSPPRFIETNLHKLSPSYTREITIRGKLSEPASITVFVNGKPKKTAPSNPDGTFAIPIELEKPARADFNQQITGNQVVEVNLEYANKIKLQAIDAAQRMTETQEFDIQYATCGAGTWVDVNVQTPLPNMLNPKLLQEGIQQIGLAFNYSYRGGGVGTIHPRDIRIKKLTLAPEFKKDYDNDLVTVRLPPVRAARADRPSGAGYVQINFNPIENPWALVDQDTSAENTPSNATPYAYEDRIANHRLNDCLVPGLGCMKLFLELEIPVSEEFARTDYLPPTQEKNIEHRVQRSCLHVEIPIDRRIPPDWLPDEFLKTTSNILGDVTEAINTVLEPIETVGRYLFYSCTAMSFAQFVPIALEKYNCEYKKFETAIVGEGIFDQNIAEIGACEQEYGADSQSAQNCKSCQEWKQRRRDFEGTYRQLCDRVMCPAAPSLQYYLKTKGVQKLETVKTTKIKPTFGSSVFAGSDCAAWMMQKQINLNARAADAGGSQTARVAPRKYFTAQEVNSIYQDYLRTKNGPTSGGIDCTKPHPATPECCGFEYMKEWDSACGVSLFGVGIDTFNEIKESTCLSAQRVGQNEINALDGSKEKCRENLINSASGLCDPEGNAPPETLKVMPFEGDAGTAPSGKLAELGLGLAKDRYLYLLVLPNEKGAQDYNIRLGYIVETLEFEKQDQRQKVSREQRHFVTSKIEGVEFPNGADIQEKYFSQADKDSYYTNPDKGPLQGYEAFARYLCEQAGHTRACPFNNAQARTLYDDVMGRIGTPDREYIVKPSEGIINSFRCMCFPTLISHLRTWRNIMNEVKRCVDTILVTGDGDAGVCQAVISQYGCDLIYEALSCFVRKFNVGQARAPSSGDIIGALTAAGSDMSRSMQARYGESSLYKTMFVDKKLVNSACVYAFTGTWNFDIDAVFDQSIEEIPTDSYALMTPCTRRFVSFNPSTRPDGLTTWVYNFGVGFAAGANADVELHLQCSGGFKCRETDGFARGKCDCDTPRDIVIQPERMPSQIKKGTILNENLLFTMQGAPGEGQIRYDKAYLKYRYEENGKTIEKKTEPCTISLVGGDGSVPGFCRFDMSTFSFRCSLGEQDSGVRIVSHNVIYPHEVP